MLESTIILFNLFEMSFQLCFSDWLGTQWSEAEDFRKLNPPLGLVSNISFLSPVEVIYAGIVHLQPRKSAISWAASKEV